ncbi:MAG: hypothetical protein ABH865_03425 [Candidatus Omnitrophota bacterium]|nr:hypothetical protein [Candidatus Omnitrophota bacterium]
MPTIFSITPAMLNLFRECPRCFWLELAKKGSLRRPCVPASGFFDGMCVLLRKRFDAYRAQGSLPPELKKIIAGVPVPQRLITAWRGPEKGLRFRDRGRFALTAHPDECVIVGTRYIPVRLRVSGGLKREGLASASILELSCYNFLLERAGYAVSRYAYDISYVFTAFNDEKTASFNVSLTQAPTLAAGTIYTMVSAAVDVLKSVVPPQESSDCRFCAWVKRAANLDRAQIKLF